MLNSPVFRAGLVLRLAKLRKALKPVMFTKMMKTTTFLILFLVLSPSLRKQIGQPGDLSLFSVKYRVFSKITEKPLVGMGLQYWTKSVINDISETVLARVLLWRPRHLSGINGFPGHSAPTRRF